MALGGALRVGEAGALSVHTGAVSRAPAGDRGSGDTQQGTGVRRYTAGVLILTSSGSSRPLRPSILLTGYHTLTTAVALILEYQSLKVLREDINLKVDL